MNKQQVKELVGTMTTSEVKGLRRLLDKRDDAIAAEEAAVYASGDLFHSKATGEYFVLSQVGFATMCLIHCETGNRVFEPITVFYDCDNVTAPEVQRMAGHAELEKVGTLIEFLTVPEEV